MSSFRAVLFYGDRSPFGAAHVAPLLAGPLELAHVFVPSEGRWAIFSANSTSNKRRGAARLLRLAGAVLEDGLVPTVTRYALIRLLRRFYQVAGTHGEAQLKRQLTTARVALGRHRIPTATVDDVNTDSLIKRLKEIQPDVILCAAFPQVFKRDLLSTPRCGAVNFHPSLLPAYRGAHPIYWVLARGEVETGVTAHLMDEHLDTGDIIAQRRLPIEPNDNYDTLYLKILTKVPLVVEEVQRALVSGRVVRTPQNEHNATFFRADRPLDRRISWHSKEPQEILNLVRAGNAFTFFRTRKAVLHRVAIVSDNRGLTRHAEVEPGTIVDVDDTRVVVAMHGACLEIHELTYLVGPVRASAFVRLFQPNVGESLG